MEVRVEVLYGLAAAFLTACMVIYYCWWLVWKKTKGQGEAMISELVSVGQATNQAHYNHLHEMEVRHEQEMIRKCQSTKADMEKAIQYRKEEIETVDARFRLHADTLEALIRGAVEGMFRTAKLREGSAEADYSSRWLYATTCMGIWRVTQKDEARIIARGMYLSKMSPIQLDQMLAELKGEAPPTPEAPVSTPLFDEEASPMGVREYEPTEEEHREALALVRAPKTYGKKVKAKGDGTDACLSCDEGTLFSNSSATELRCNDCGRRYIFDKATGNLIDITQVRDIKAMAPCMVLQEQSQGQAIPVDYVDCKRANSLAEVGIDGE